MSHRTWLDRRLLKTAAVVLAALPMVLASGCGGSAVGGLVQTKGRVTLNGGPWPKEGVINFNPTGAQGTQAGFRPVSAKFDTQGNFTVTDFEGSSGLFPGAYQVSVNCWDVEPGMDEKGKPSGKSHIPAKFQNSSTSGLTYEVKSGNTADAVFDVKTK